MSHNPASIEYHEISPERIELIQPLWEKLKAFHVPLSPRLAARRSARTFDVRRQQFLEKSTIGKLKVDVACADSTETLVAFCVSSLAPDGSGEVDALFVAEDYRGKGLGTELVRRALAWLDELDATSKKIVVAYGNGSALRFYQQFGFVADNISLQQATEAVP